MDTIEARLRHAITKRGQSLTDFAREVGVPYRTLQDHVAGKALPSAPQLAAFARVGIDIVFVLTGITGEGERIAAALEAEADRLPCADDAVCWRAAAGFVRERFQKAP